MNAFSDMVDTLFGDDNLAKAAIYTPLSGPSLPCRVILDRRDRQIEVGVGNAFAEGRTIDVRVSEIQSPKKGETFLVGTTSYIVLESPKTDDSERLVWSFRVS